MTPDAPRRQGEVSGGVQRDWVDCPICGENNMHRGKVPSEELYLIACTNYACRSNGGTTDRDMATLLEQLKYRCETCGSKLYLNGCSRCGAPVCCTSCCLNDALQHEKQAVEEKHRQLGVHLSHCNFGENIGQCKYAENEICPALTESWSWFGKCLTDHDKRVSSIFTERTAIQQRVTELEAQLAAAQATTRCALHREHGSEPYCAICLQMQVDALLHRIQELEAAINNLCDAQKLYKALTATDTGGGPDERN